MIFFKQQMKLKTVGKIDSFLNQLYAMSVFKMAIKAFNVKKKLLNAIWYKCKEYDVHLIEL